MWSLLKALEPKKVAVWEETRIDRLTYAIGDIHGCSDLFKILLRAIKRDARQIGERPRIVLLGDYIDRGPDSSGVLDAILALEAVSWCDTHILLGNHEVMLKRFMLDPDFGREWMMYGGAATLASYGVKPPHPRCEDKVWAEARLQLARQMPTSHAALIDRAALKLMAGDFVFVHAGVKPGTPLKTQGPDTLLWIRDEFLRVHKSCDFAVIHGHSAQQDVQNENWRIGVDTGAFATGVLTAVRLNGHERHFLNATRQRAAAA